MWNWETQNKIFEIIIKFLRIGSTKVRALYSLQRTEAEFLVILWACI